VAVVRGLAEGCAGRSEHVVAGVEKPRLHEQLLDTDSIAVDLALAAAGELVWLRALVRAGGARVDQARSPVDVRGRRGQGRVEGRTRRVPPEVSRPDCAKRKRVAVSSVLRPKWRDGKPSVGLVRTRDSRTGALGAARLELSTLGRASRRRFGLELRVLAGRAGSSRKAGLVGEKEGVVGDRGPRSELEPNDDVAGEKTASDTRRPDVPPPPFRSGASTRFGGGACLLMKTGSDALRGGGKTGRFDRATAVAANDVGLAKPSG
jgi:hypothetical protein